MNTKTLMAATFGFATLTFALCLIMGIAYTTPGSVWAVWLGPVAIGIGFTAKYGRLLVLASIKETLKENHNHG